MIRNILKSTEIQREMTRIVTKLFIIQTLKYIYVYIYVIYICIKCIFQVFFLVCLSVSFSACMCVCVNVHLWTMKPEQEIGILLNQLPRIGGRKKGRCYSLSKELRFNLANFLWVEKSQRYSKKNLPRSFSWANMFSTSFLNAYSYAYRQV